MTSGSTHHLAPDDIATIYNIAPLYQAGVDGTGQKIAVVGQTAIRHLGYRSVPHQVQPAADQSDSRSSCRPRNNPGIVDGDVDEAHLDIEWASAVARNATIVYVYSPDVWTSAQYAVNQQPGARDHDELRRLRAVRSRQPDDVPAGRPAGERAGDHVVRGLGRQRRRRLRRPRRRHGAERFRRGFARRASPRSPAWAAPCSTSRAARIGTPPTTRTAPRRRATFPSACGTTRRFGELSGGGGGASVMFPAALVADRTGRSERWRAARSRSLAQLLGEP